MFDSFNNLSSNFNNNLTGLYDIEHNENKTSSSKIFDNCGKDELQDFEYLSSESESGSFFQGTISSTSLKDNELLKSFIYGILHCTKCMIPCSIIFNDNFTISFECGCSFIKYISIKEFMNDYIKKGYYQKEEYSLHCMFHFEQKIFIKYCIDCEHDICEECMNMEYPLQSNNKTTSKKKHDNHTFINYDQIKEKFNIINELIQKYERGVYYNNIKDVKKEKIQNVFKVINCIIETFEKYKCYNLYKSIENAEIFLKKINDINFIFDDKDYPLINLLKITTDKEFAENINNFSENIISIHLTQIENKIDLSLFQNKKFLHLKDLTLISDKFKEDKEDIYSLSSSEFPVLEILSLGDNNFGNKIIDVLDKLNLPKLIFLNLYSNNITDIKLFDVIKKFEKLKHLFVGENPFKIEENPKEFYEFPKSMEEFGMTGNLEGKRCAFIKRLDISNLKIFYISRNKIGNLSYIENIKFKRLEKFYSMRNDIKDIYEILKIQGKENLKSIDLRDNNINNFKELINIIDKFPNLERIVVSGNEGINEAQIKKMKNQIGRELDIII